MLRRASSRQRQPFRKARPQDRPARADDTCITPVAGVADLLAIGPIHGHLQAQSGSPSCGRAAIWHRIAARRENDRKRVEASVLLLLGQEADHADDKAATIAVIVQRSEGRQSDLGGSSVARDAYVPLLLCHERNRAQPGPAPTSAKATTRSRPSVSSSREGTNAFVQLSPLAHRPEFGEQQVFVRWAIERPRFVWCQCCVLRASQLRRWRGPVDGSSTGPLTEFPPRRKARGRVRGCEECRAGRSLSAPAWSSGCERGRPCGPTGR